MLNKNIRIEDLNIVSSSNIEGFTIGTPNKEASKEVDEIVVSTYKKVVNKRIVINPYSTIEKPIVVVRKLCEANIGLKRKALVELATLAGVNINTAKTQVQRYLKRIKTSQLLRLPSPEAFK